MTKLEALKKQYSKAVRRLDEILKKRKTKIVRDSAIKRFEFTFDLAWKLTKTYLYEKKGVVCVSPKECFREAYRVKLIDYSELWITMTDWRNQSVHIYREELADKLFRRLPETLKLFKSLLESA